MFIVQLFAHYLRFHTKYISGEADDVNKWTIYDHHHHTTTVLRRFFRDHPGELVPEENF